MSLFKELKRRNVFRVTAAYVVISWLLLQVGDVVFEALEVDASANRLLMALVLLGLIPTILFAWAFEITPDGIKRDKDVQIDEHQDRQKAKKLNYITMFVLVLVGGMSLWQHWSDPSEPIESDIAAETNLDDNNDLVDLTEVNEQSIAVLPFMNVAQSADNEPFTVGLHDDLISHLSKISALKVISKTSVLKYKDSPKSINEIAKDLRVAHVLEGGVQRAGQSIRFNVQLVNAATEKPIWAETYDRELTASNIFKIQSEISESIVRALKANLTMEEIISLKRQQTTNLDAYNAYLAGRQRLLVRNSDSIREALKLFEKATQLDPNYALAYVGQADAWSLLSNYAGITKDEMFAKGEPMIEMAISLDPTLAEAQTTKANYLNDRKQFEASRNLFEYSIKLNPNYATTYHWYGILADSMGDQEKALMLYRKAAELDPLSPVIQTNIGYQLLRAKQKQEALKQFDRIIELVPEYSGGASGKAETLAQMGRIDKAVLWQKKSVDTDQGNFGRQLDLIGFYVELGLIEKAKQSLLEIENQAPNYKGLIYGWANIDLYESNYQQASDRFSRKMLEDPEDKSYQGNWAFYQMLLKNYSASINVLLKLHPGKNGELFNVSHYNFDSTINLIWMWKQIGEIEKSKQLLTQLKQFLAEYPKHDAINKQAMIAAVEGKYLESIKLFNQLFKNGEFQGFWRGDHLPMFESFEEIPESQFLTKAYDKVIEQQRTALLAQL